jgi:hypothetical protein
MWGKVVRDATFKGGQETLFASGFEGSQAMPVRPSGRGLFERVKLWESTRYET